MRNEFSLEEVRGVWQNQNGGFSPMALDEVHKRAGQFDKTIRKDNIELLVVYFFLIACFSFSIVVSSNPVQRLGAVLIILGVGYVSHQIRMRQLQARATTATAEKMGRSATVDLYRSALKRERDLFRGGSLWSRVLIIAPGLPVLCIGEAIAHPNEAQMLRLAALVYLLFLVAVVPLSLRRARKYQTQINELDALKKES